MLRLPTIVILAGALALAACNNPDRYGAGGAGGAGGIGVGALGDPNDPNSPAYFAQTIGDTVRFDVDQHTIRAEAQPVLTQQAVWLNQHPTYVATIEGHADEQGTEAYNMALSDRRANEVKRFLVSQGVADTRLKTIPYGKLRPLAICSDEACYAQNRRAVTVVSVGAGS
ncbi:MAG: peptidoglycan-associated lipoprotein [Paracoccaceae bacterium]